MPTFIIQARQTVIYRITVDAETIEDAVEAVEDETVDFSSEHTDLTETSTTGFEPFEYATEGQMGWSPVPDTTSGGD